MEHKLSFAYFNDKKFWLGWLIMHAALVFCHGKLVMVYNSEVPRNN